MTGVRFLKNAEVVPFFGGAGERGHRVPRGMASAWYRVPVSPLEMHPVGSRRFALPTPTTHSRVMPGLVPGIYDEVQVRQTYRHPC